MTVNVLAADYSLEKCRKLSAVTVIMNILVYIRLTPEFVIYEIVQKNYII